MSQVVRVDRTGGQAQRATIVWGVFTLTFRRGPRGKVYEVFRSRSDRGDDFTLPRAPYLNILRQAHAILC